METTLQAKVIVCNKFWANLELIAFSKTQLINPIFSFVENGKGFGLWKLKIKCGGETCKPVQITSIQYTYFMLLPAIFQT